MLLASTSVGTSSHSWFAALVRLYGGRWLAGAASLLLAGPAADGANLTPVAVTGFNRDVVIENTASGPPYTNAAMNFNAGENTCFYQSGLPGKSYGLPASGSFTSALGDGTQFQFQSYTANNALVMSSDTGLTNGTLTLVTPATYSRIAFIANSGNADSIGAANVKLRFNDGTTLVTTYDAPDWFFNTANVALQGVERIDLSSGATSGAPDDPRFYQTTIDLFGLLGFSNKPLASLTFAQPSTARSTGIYAVSGLQLSALTAPVVTNSPATNVQATSATLGGQVLSTGSEAPIVTIYFGLTDGGTSAAAWQTNVGLGAQSGTFSRTVASLLTNRTYYYTAKGANEAGTSWAVPSQLFTTPVPTLPVVSNLAATSITATTASLGGQIVSTGGDPPAVTLYYGAADGGTNAGAWARSLPLGTQSGAFVQTVFELSMNATYYFTAQAVNSAGAVWVTPSKAFTTLPANPPPAAILTQHNDNFRTGANLIEWLLNVSNVNTSRFGLLYTRAVDDQIYAQPLVMTNVTLPGRGARNLLFIATVNDSVYAFDADDSSVNAPYWHVSFLGPNVVAPRNTDMTNACGGNYQDFSGNIGIVGTPVIDPASRTLYLVARTKEFGTNFVQRLHALDLSTGAERANSPVVISATYSGTGDGNVNNVITFDSLRQNQRPALALVNGLVYIGWSSHCDWGPYHGWLIGYDASTLQRMVVYNDTPEGSDGGLWMSGQGPSADTNGNLYVSVGNGSVGTNGNPRATINRGESFLKLSRSGTNLTVASWFTPSDWQSLESVDADLGSAGLLLIPGTTLAFSGGKEGTAYLVNRDNMGGLSFGNADTNIVQSFPVSPDEIHGGPIWWDGADGSYCYIWPASVNLQQYRFDRAAGMFVLPALAQSPTPAPANGQPGGLLSLSANGTNAGTGIVWACHQLSGDANQQVRPGILHAYNAQNVAGELWNSEQISARDSVGNLAKFVVPTVANGKVYLATFSNRLNVYGLLPLPTLSITLLGGTITLAWPTNGFVNSTLQSSSNLLSGAWMNVPNSPVGTNGGFQVKLPATAPGQFYRLKQ